MSRTLTIEIIRFIDKNGAKYELRQPHSDMPLMFYPICEFWSECQCYTTEQLLNNSDFKIYEINIDADTFQLTP